MIKNSYSRPICLPTSHPEVGRKKKTRAYFLSLRVLPRHFKHHSHLHSLTRAQSYSCPQLQRKLGNIFLLIPRSHMSKNLRMKIVGHLEVSATLLKDSNKIIKPSTFYFIDLNALANLLVSLPLKNCLWEELLVFPLHISIALWVWQDLGTPELSLLIPYLIACVFKQYKTPLKPPNLALNLFKSQDLMTSLQELQRREEHINLHHRKVINKIQVVVNFTGK